MSERGQPLAVTRDGHLLQRTAQDLEAQLLNPVLLHGQHVGLANGEQHLHVAGQGVLRLDHRHTQGRFIDPRVGELAGLGVLEIGDAKQLVGLGGADDAVAPEDAVDDILLEALLAHGDAGLQGLGVDVVSVNGAVLDDAGQGLVVGPGHADQPAAGVLPDGLGELDAGAVEDAELAEGGLGVELDDLRVVSDDGDRPAEGRAGDLVPAEVDVLPAHTVELGLAVVTVVEELPLGGDRDVRHFRRLTDGPLRQTRFRFRNSLQAVRSC